MLSWSSYLRSVNIQENQRAIVPVGICDMIIQVLSSNANDDPVNIHLGILSQSVQILLVFLNEASDHYQE